MGINNRRGDLDKYDVAILSALATDTRLTTVELAAIVHLSRTAVSRRITTLRQKRVLHGAAEVLDYESLGFSVRALVEVNAPSGTAELLRQDLLVQPEVLNVAIIAGDGCLCADVIATDVEHLHRFVHTLLERGHTSTKIIFDVQKSKLTLIERMRKLAEESDPALVKP